MISEEQTGLGFLSKIFGIFFGILTQITKDYLRLPRLPEITNKRSEGFPGITWINRHYQGLLGIFMGRLCDYQRLP